jgi:hypothetical protein
MDEKVRTAADDYENSKDSMYLEWRWWHNVLGVAIILAIVIVISW